MKTFTFYTLILLIWTLQSCDFNKQSTPYQFPDIWYYPDELNIPSDNPTTVEGVELGRYLFYDGRLSGRTDPDSLMSCATCHLQRNGFDTGFDHPKFKNGKPVGLKHIPTHHYTLPLVNLVYNSNAYFWSGYINSHNIDSSFNLSPTFQNTNIESVVRLTILDPAEIAGTPEKTVAAIKNDPRYPAMFKQAFGSEEINMDRIAKAIAQFVRSIISNNSKYHKVLAKEATFTESEKRGMELFYSEKADCFHCHGGFLLTSNEFFNNAKDSLFTDRMDHFGVSRDSMDIGAFKAPSLINVELTGPYMHDGRFKTLEEVIDFYSEGLVNSEYAHPLMKQVAKGGVHLTDAEKVDLLAFLKTFTDHKLLTDPKFGRPEDL